MLCKLQSSVSRSWGSFHCIALCEFVNIPSIIESLIDEYLSHLQLFTTVVKYCDEHYYTHMTHLCPQDKFLNFHCLVKEYENVHVSTLFQTGLPVRILRQNTILSSKPRSWSILIIVIFKQESSASRWTGNVIKCSQCTVLGQPELWSLWAPGPWQTEVPSLPSAGADTAPGVCSQEWEGAELGSLTQEQGLTGAHPLAVSCIRLLPE